MEVNEPFFLQKTNYNLNTIIKFLNILKNSSLLAKFLNAKKLTFAANSVNLLTSQLQIQRDLLGSFYLIFHLKFYIRYSFIFFIKTNNQGCDNIETNI